MGNDSIHIKKLPEEDFYGIEIYFGSINSTVSIKLREIDLARLLERSVQLINDHSQRFVVEFPDNWNIVGDMVQFEKTVSLLRADQDTEHKARS